MSAYATISDLDTYTQNSVRAREVYTRVSTQTELITVALQEATNRINSLSFIGYPQDSVMAFPRVEQTTIPVAVVQACMEIAIALLDGVDPELEFESLFHAQDALETARTTYNRAEVPMHTLLGICSHRAYMLLAPYLRATGDIGISRV